MIKTTLFNLRLVAIKLLILSVIGLTPSVLSCKANYNAQEAQLKETIVKELGNDYSTSFNESKTYALCQQKRMGDHQNRKIKFIVVDVATNRVVNSGSFQSGYVKWITNESIEVATSDKPTADLTKTIIPVKSNL